MPYPFSDTDPITPLQDLLNDTVEAVTSSIQSGTDTVDIVSSGTAVSKTVTFPVAYGVGVVPRVVVSSAQAVPHQRFVSAYNATNTQFTVTAINTASSADVIFQWIAQG